MSIRLPPRRHRAATLLALLLLVLRLAVPTHAMPAQTAGEDAALAQVLGGVPICHADAAGPAAPEPASPALPSAHDCALCPACQLAAPALLPAASWVSAPLPSGPAQAAFPPPATGPPSPERRAAPPRGPPASAV